MAIDHNADGLAPVQGLHQVLDVRAQRRRRSDGRQDFRGALGRRLLRGGRDRRGRAWGCLRGLGSEFPFVPRPPEKQEEDGEDEQRQQDGGGVGAAVHGGEC